MSSVPETGTFLAELEAEKLNDSKNKEYFIIAVYDENGISSKPKLYVGSGSNRKNFVIRLLSQYPGG